MHYIGHILKNRMDMLGISIFDLSEITFINKDIIQAIVENKRAYEEIDVFDLSLICNALHCDMHYFIDDKVRNNDLLISTMNKNKDSSKSITVKAKIQDFVNDFTFLKSILN